MTNKSLSNFKDSIHHSLKTKEKMDVYASENKKNLARSGTYILIKATMMIF